MKSLTVAQAVDMHKIASAQAWLFALEIRIKDAAGIIVDTLRVVRNDEDVTIDGQSYIAAPFEISNESNLGELPKVSVTIQDQLRVLQVLLNDHTGAVGSAVDLKVVTPINGTANAQSEMVETFSILSTSVSDSVVQIELGAENPLRIQIPRRIQVRSRCSFHYKSAACGYTGALPTCDLTLNGDNGCAAHNNTKNFGGFPGLVPRRV